LATALAVIPVVYFSAADLTMLVIAFIISVRAGPVIGTALWHPDSWMQLQVLWFYAIVTATIWYLPLAAYLLTISAWAKRAVTLWSILPPIALLLGERLFSGTHVIADVLENRLIGYAPAAFHTNPMDGSWVTTMVDNDTIRTPSSIWSLIDVGGFFSNAATWIGAAVGVGLVVCAIQLRMRRTEI
jgi:hypothetical protein